MVSAATNRRVRVFVSSTFRDMVDERNRLMTHTWPALRSFCQRRGVEFIEVDLRWGIPEEQSVRKETLKFCLDEIRSCRPYFIGLLGERYGWTPGGDAFTADLTEEQPWLKGLHGKSVTELEILHGVLNDTDMAGRAFFYFRDPAYSRNRGDDFAAEGTDAEKRQAALKALVRKTCATNNIPLREDYADPSSLADLVLADLTSSIEMEFPLETVPDSLTREAQDHETFAESRRRTYIGRTEYLETLDRHASGDGGPLLVLGDSGSGKSALLANWVLHWRKDHPKDFMIQHYISGTSDSADHWRIIARVVAAIKHWSGDAAAVPATHDEMLRDFPFWLGKARARAALDGVRFILVLDALNQLDDRDHARLLGWLPEHPFSGPLRLVVSVTPGKPGATEPLDVVKARGWHELRVAPLTLEERRRLITEYLARFGKRLGAHHLDRLAVAEPAANPLYLKILLDDIRVTGTHERLEERLEEYLSAADVPTLLTQVLLRYQRDYEHDCPGLVARVLGSIYAARRGLSEKEILHLLRPRGKAQLPPAIWAPLRAALEESLVDSGGVLTFAHDFLREAVWLVFVSSEPKLRDIRLMLTAFFNDEAITHRTCHELPWLLWKTESRERLRRCILDIDRFQLIFERDRAEVRDYWVFLRDESRMAAQYSRAFRSWEKQAGRESIHVASVATQLASLFYLAASYGDSASMARHALETAERCLPDDHPVIAATLNTLSETLRVSHRFDEALPLMRRALRIAYGCYGEDHPEIAIKLNTLSLLLRDMNFVREAASVLRQALAIREKHYGLGHPRTAELMSNLAEILHDMGICKEAELLKRRVLNIDERHYGDADPLVALDLNNLAELLRDTNRTFEADTLLRRALRIDERVYGERHPFVARDLNNLALVCDVTGRSGEAEALLRRALAIDESWGGDSSSAVGRDLGNLAGVIADRKEAENMYRRALAINIQHFGHMHTCVATTRNNLAGLVQTHKEAEELFRAALRADERSLGNNHPSVGRDLSNLAGLLRQTHRQKEAIALSERAVRIFLDILESQGYHHPDLGMVVLNHYSHLLAASSDAASCRDEVGKLLLRYGLTWDDVLDPTVFHAIARNLKK
jgi:nephrocystin-3